MKFFNLAVISLLFYSFFPSNSIANVEVRVVDVGAGLCSVIQLPNNKYIIYDAGHFRGRGNSTFQQIQELIPLNSEIELMVLSHTDGDHIGAASQIINNYKVKNVLSTGYEKSMVYAPKPTGTYTRFINAINSANYNINYTDLNKSDSTISPGTKMNIDDTEITFLCGFGKPQSDWETKTNGEKLNSVSIVMKVSYHGSSVLFCGDAVGRHIKSKPNTLIATEKYLVINAHQYLKSDIIIAPHHGANNGSSETFIAIVDPEVVIYSAGHHHNHPTKDAAQRYLDNGVLIENIFRTDRGDDEREEGETSYEWDYLRLDGCTDSFGDDDVHITLNTDDSFNVRYINPENVCDN